MKKSLFIVFMFLVFTGSAVHAAIIKVDNKVPSAGQYSTLQAAHDAASSGDTIYVYPSLINYTGITVNKQLHFIGTGFGRPAVDLPTTNISGTMTFAITSDGSSLEGFGKGEFIVSISANNIVIKRNQLKTIIVAANSVGISINANLIKTFDTNGGIQLGSYSESLITNNIIRAPFYTSNWQCVYTCIGKCTSVFVSTVIKHNAIIGYNWNQWAISLDPQNNAIAVNNIFANVRPGNVNSAVYNIFDHESISGEGNILVSSIGFVDATNHDYHLLPNSPARGAGQNGVDMGIYGGSTPFVDGGAPGIPSIIQIQSDHAGSQEGGLDVIIKAKSNKE